MSFGQNPTRTVLSVAVAAALAAPVNAQEPAGRKIEEIFVTATKVEESLQDVPISVTALGSEQLDELGIANFSDYVLQLPSVTAGGSGPGQNTIYIRGVASTTPNLTVAGVAGLAPNVAFYLDEQPLAQPGRNLDVYAADLERIEVLSGPQGTLFGSSSQAGNVRLITKKPEFGETYGYVKVGAGTITDGGNSGNIEAMLNLPLTDTFAVRGVFYTDTRGGWIDNVEGPPRTAAESARFRPAGTVRENGVPVSDVREGFQADADLSGVTFLEATNENLVEEDFNETTYTGGRISFRWDVTNNLRLDLQHTEQDLDADGVFFADPDLGDLSVARYSPDELEDSFSNTAWTASLLLGQLELLYTGAYTDRDSDQIVDYTDYLLVGQYLPYYICDTAVSYPSYSALANPAGTCQAPNLFVDSINSLESTTHEFRVTTDQAKSLRLTAGVFYQDLELAERNDFTYPGSINAVSTTIGETGFPANYPLTNLDAPPGAINSASAGYFSDPGPFPEGVIFRNDVLRTDEQLGVFGELTYDFNEQFAVTVGARWYDIEVDLQGSANSSFFNFGLFDTYADSQRGGTNISAQFAPDNTVGAPENAATDGTIFKLTGTWRPNNDLMFYGTISEGFRAGLLNRPGGASGPGGFTVPFALDTDEVTNFELGTKSTFFGGSFQVNAAAFFIDVERLQTTIFDPSITNLFFSDNAADAEVMGLEGDFIWLPNWSDILTVSGAFSFLDTEITEVITPTDDVREGDELAYAPDFQGTLRARWEWTWGGTNLLAHVMPSVTWSSESFSDIIIINRDRIDSWAMASITAGLSSDWWSAELFINNLTDERAEVARDFVFDTTRVTYAQPLTFGIRTTFNF